MKEVNTHTVKGKDKPINRTNPWSVLISSNCLSNRKRYHSGNLRKGRRQQYGDKQQVLKRKCQPGEGIAAGTKLTARTEEPTANISEFVRCPLNGSWSAIRR